MNILALITDAFGGRGGIAKFNRDLLTVLSSNRDVTSVIALPRLINEDESIDELPYKLKYVTHASKNIVAYLFQMVKQIIINRNKLDYIVCGHVRLTPIAITAAKILNKPCLLIVHGIEAWKKPKGFGRAIAVEQMDQIVSVSEFTKQKLLNWANLDEDKVHVIPNCVELGKFGPGPKPDYLKKRYGITNEKIILTLGRLAGKDRAKGFDEILELLPDLIEDDPSIRYMIAGDGDDRKRLEDKAIKLGIRDKVIFTGYVPEEEKADHYRLADLFAMPGRGEGFGIVYLEAMACGIPVVASKADASREAVLNGELGEIVDPDDLDSIKEGIIKSLQKNRKVPEKLEYFNFTNFTKRWNKLLEKL